MGEALLEARGITKRFGAVTALDGVDLTVLPGEIVALAGENGSGKSTLSGIVAGMLPPDAGMLRIGGREVSFSSARAALDAGVALVSQEPASVPDLSIAENVLLPRLRPAAGVAHRRLRREAAEHLERVGLRCDPSIPLRALPPGERELVELARAVAAEPSLLLLDEVTTRLPDPERLFAVVEQLAAEGVGTVFITHRLWEIRRLASRAVVLRDGRLVGELDRGELTDERLSAAMVGRELSGYYAKADTSIGEPVLELVDLVTDRAPTPVSLRLHAGEVVGVAGLVGSGRSELLETIGGIRRVRGGTVRLAGRRLGGGPAGAIAAGIALVPEDRYAQALVRHASVADNLALARHRLTGRTHRRREQQQAADTIARYGVRCTGGTAPVGSLSGGNAQKLVLARALEQQPRVLLLDEPTRGVDVGARAEIYRLVGEMAARGVAVLLASSDLLELIGVCDRVVVLHDGEVAGEVPRERATEEAIAYLSLGGGRQ